VGVARLTFSELNAALNCET